MLSALKSAVMFCAHTDDEMVCAGTLHRLARMGCEVTLVAFSFAATKDDRAGTEDSLFLVDPEWRNSLRIIGAQQYPVKPIIPSADFQPYRQRICQDVYDYCESKKPDLAIILSPHDENTAHSIVGIECERVMRGRVPHVWRCQFPWNYGKGDNPNLYVELSLDDLIAKQRVIEAYKSQQFRYNYGEMLLSYCRADGLSVKVERAEKFEVVRSVV